MAQKVAVTLEDDFDGGAADETVRFGIDGADYEIDLSAKNARRFRKQLAPFVEHARKAARGLSRRAGRRSASRQHSAEIRAWAKAHGVAVNDRGRRLVRRRLRVRGGRPAATRRTWWAWRASYASRMRWLRVTMRQAIHSVSGVRPVRRHGLPRVFRTAELELIHAARYRFRYSSWTSCGVL